MLPQPAAGRAGGDNNATVHQGGRRRSPNFWSPRGVVRHGRVVISRVGARVDGDGAAGAVGRFAIWRQRGCALTGSGGRGAEGAGRLVLRSEYNEEVRASIDGAR